MKIIPAYPSRPGLPPCQASASSSVAPVGVAFSSSARRTIAALGAVVLAFAVTTGSSGSPADFAPVPTLAQTRDPVLMRGRYLVENVGLCADCHTPRDEKGQFDRSRWLLGASLPFQPLVPMPWSQVAPPLAGLPSMTESQALVFMQKGTRPDGSLPRPPMPEFRFAADDAKAVVKYLMSLKSEAPAAVVPAAHATMSK